MTETLEEPGQFHVSSPKIKKRKKMDFSYQSQKIKSCDCLEVIRIDSIWELEEKNHL